MTSPDPVVERVARAMYEANWGEDWQQERESYKDLYRVLARAAVAAMAVEQVNSDSVTYVPAEQFDALMNDDEPQPSAALRAAVARMRAERSVGGVSVAPQTQDTSDDDEDALRAIALRFGREYNADNPSAMAQDICEHFAAARSGGTRPEPLDVAAMFPADPDLMGSPEGDKKGLRELKAAAQKRIDDLGSGGTR